MRHTARLGRRFDGVICMWQSFGHFDAAQNTALLSALANVVERHGWLLLDIYNAEFFRRHQGARSYERRGTKITERTSLTGERVRIELWYDGRPDRDVFDWQIFDPEAIGRAFQNAGWSVVAQCREFNDALAPSRDHPRMQLVAEVACSR